jgi:hypothetical protein
MANAQEPRIISDKKLATERRQRIFDALLELITDPAGPFDTATMHHFAFVSGMCGPSEEVRKLASWHDDWPEVRQEVLLAIAIEAINAALS